MSLFPSTAVAAFADVIIALLNEHPEDWKMCSSRCVLEHPSGVGIWVANGFSFCRLYSPRKVHFGWKKVPLWRACRKAMRADQERHERENLEAAAASLKAMRDNVVTFRRSRA